MERRETLASHCFCIVIGVPCRRGDVFRLGYGRRLAPAQCSAPGNLTRNCTISKVTEPIALDYGCMPRTIAKLSPPAPGAIAGALPAAQAPQLCQLVTEAPESADWLSEIKFDGYRLIAAINEGRVRLLTRRGLDWADRLPHVAAAFARLDVSTAMLNGELVALRPDGVSSFPELQALLSAGAAPGCTSTCSTCCTSTAGTCGPVRWSTASDS
jgi:hypothetical protein